MSDKKTPNASRFSFEISLSVLNHLGRNLYRSFVTVLGEAISNAWDAEATNVWIHIDKTKNNFFIKDDGAGMTAGDFQNKFLKIGYSKRKDGENRSPIKRRPYIGRKGIGKLALLSCAEKITVISRTKTTEYVGGVIDNSGLDNAITQDLTPQQYPLGEFEQKTFGKFTRDHRQGTIIYFENIKGGIKNTLGLLKKIIALYFKFSLLDKSFNIFVDGEKITYSHLKDLAEKTEFLWNINDLNDPYVQKMLKSLKERKSLKTKGTIKGFIASVSHYKDLTIMNLDDRVSIDLYVNGRLRERDILKHISKSRLVDNYLYGQIHFDELDDKTKDRFTSNREGVVSDDSKYQSFLKKLEDDIIGVVINDWDKWRRKHREDGDSENKSISPKERKSQELFNVVSGEYSPPKGSANKDKVDKWVDDLADDARYNFSSYAECFISENLIRKHIQENKIPLSSEAKTESDKWRKREEENKDKGNVSIKIRRVKSPLSYLSMDDLANLVDKKDRSKFASLSRDASEYKPIRDAIAHTALLTDKAKQKLSSVYENIKGRIKSLLSKEVA